jgi:hypothetical protein
MPINKTIATFVFTPTKDEEMSLVKVSEVQGDVLF